MKKNKMMRLASAMMVMTLMTTSVISGTFAKYTTQDSGSDAARVAKWGVELHVVGDLYGHNYLTGTNTKTLADSGISVKSFASPVDNVVAPGTKNDGTGLLFSLNGQPEVSSRVKAKIETQNIYLKGEETYGVMVPVELGTVTAENFTSDVFYTYASDTYTKADAYDSETTQYYTLEDDVTLGAGYYYPVIYKLGGTTNSTGSYTEDTLATAAIAIVNAIKGTYGTSNVAPGSDSKTTYEVTSDVILPNTVLATELGLGSETLSWEWAFDNDACDDEGNDAGNYCKADTILGDLMVENNRVVKKDTDTTYIAPVVNEDYCLKTSFSIDITVTQVD